MVGEEVRDHEPQVVGVRAPEGHREAQRRQTDLSQLDVEVQSVRVPAEPLDGLRREFFVQDVHIQLRGELGVGVVQGLPRDGERKGVGVVDGEYNCRPWISTTGVIPERHEFICLPETDCYENQDKRSDHANRMRRLSRLRSVVRPVGNSLASNG